MITPTLTLDETLLQRRRVLRSEPDPLGTGFYLKLECGHQLWFPALPAGKEFCGPCLEKLVRQIRDVQSHQEPA